MSSVPFITIISPVPFIGNNYETTYNEFNENNDIIKKSGIEEIEYSESRKLTKTRYKLNKKSNVIEDSGLPGAQGTFGWGSVHNEFPAENTGGEMYFFKKSEDDKCFQLYISWNGTDGNKYTTVWRYER